MLFSKRSQVIMFSNMKSNFSKTFLGQFYKVLITLIIVSGFMFSILDVNYSINDTKFGFSCKGSSAGVLTNWIMKD